VRVNSSLLAIISSLDRCSGLRFLGLSTPPAHPTTIGIRAIISSIMWRRCTAIFAAITVVFSASNDQTLASIASATANVDPHVAPMPSFTKEYWDWFYRWHRGGAFALHDTVHPCYMNNQTCSITDAAELRKGVLRVNTTIIPQRAFIELHYDLGDEDAREGDFIGVYCVDQDEHPSAAVPSSDFIDYLPINATQEDSFRGAFIVGPLMNMRCAYQFRYVRHVEKLDYKTISESPHVEMLYGSTEPVQIHLALTETPGEMRATWTSGKGAHQHVHYGKSATNLTQHAEASTQTYDASDMCSAPATNVAAQWFRHPGYIHQGVMKDLVPGEKYYYTVGSKFGIVSKPIAFTFPPLPGDAPSKTDRQSFFVFGDLDQGILTERLASHPAERHFTDTQYESRMSATSEKTVINRIEQDLREDRDGNFVAVVHVGDLSYAKGRTFIWDQYGALVERVASTLPYMVAIGNHEYDYVSGGKGHDLSGSQVGETNGWHPPEGNFRNDSKGECGVPTVKRFYMPKSSAKANPPFWYSFRLGLSHHIILSSEHDCNVHSPMHKWLTHELLHNVNRTETPWLLVHLHRPLYCSENFPSDYHVSLLLRECLEHQFMKHHVDVVFSGHYHAYERTCPVYQEACRVDKGQAKAPVHIMIGSGGAELDDINYLEDEGANEPKPRTVWSLDRQQEYGYGRFHVFNASHAQIEFVRARDRNVTDSAWIVSTHDWTL
jgi:acid phosphatase type 7